MMVVAVTAAMALPEKTPMAASAATVSPAERKMRVDIREMTPVTRVNPGIYGMEVPLWYQPRADANAAPSCREAIPLQ